MSTSNGKARRIVRHNRLRSKISGTPDRPRLAVYRSISHIYAQLIDDVEGNTIASASSLENELKTQGKDSGKLYPKWLGSRLVEKLRIRGLVRSCLTGEDINTMEGLRR